MNVGSELREARERRRLSIEDLSRRTKIKPLILNAIDENDAARLPGGIFTRAFVKQYAREVGLDPIEIASRYEAQFEPEPVAVPPVEKTQIDVDDDAAPPDSSSDPLRFDDARVLGIAALLVLALASFSVFTRSRAPIAVAATRAAAPVTATRPASTTATDTAVPRPVGTSGTIALVATDRARSLGRTGPAPVASASISTAAPPVVPAGPGVAAPTAAVNAHAVQVELRPRGLCWITAIADGKRSAFRLMSGGERLLLTASNDLVLRVGDAASLDFSVNGSRGRTLGGRAEAVTIRLTPANYRTFVAQ